MMALLVAQADEADAKKLLKSMSDCAAAQTAVSFDFDVILEVLTQDNQKLALAISGAVIINRPGKIRATRGWRLQLLRSAVVCEHRDLELKTTRAGRFALPASSTNGFSLCNGAE
jgi:hypothetical protein